MPERSRRAYSRTDDTRNDSNNTGENRTSSDYDVLRYSELTSTQIENRRLLPEEALLSRENRNISRENAILSIEVIGRNASIGIEELIEENTTNNGNDTREHGIYSDYYERPRQISYEVIRNIEVLREYGVTLEEIRENEEFMLAMYELIRTAERLIQATSGGIREDEGLMQTISEIRRRLEGIPGLFREMEELEPALQASLDNQPTPPIDVQRTEKLLDTDLSMIDKEIYSRACAVAIATVEEIDGDMGRTRMQEHIFVRDLGEEINMQAEEFKQLIELHREKVFPYALRQAECEMKLEPLQEKLNKGESLSQEEEHSLQKLLQEHKEITQKCERIIQEEQQKLAQTLPQQQGRTVRSREETSQSIRRGRSSTRPFFDAISRCFGFKNQSS